MNNPTFINQIITQPLAPNPMNAIKFLPAFLVALVSGLSLLVSPVVAADTEGPEISAIEPLVATWNVPQLFYAYVDDPSGVDSCVIVVSEHLRR